jgi:pyruvate dehydrogenase E2 component (dihydrolipoamide acetyltransferase)
MATQVVMPKLSPTMEEGQLSRWLKQEGDKVSMGEPLAEIDTDKATMEMQALGSGVLRKILIKEGESAPLGQLIAVIGEPDEDISGLLAGAESSKAASETKAPVEEPVKETAKAGGDGAQQETSQTSAESEPTAQSGNGSSGAAAQADESKDGGRLIVSPIAARMAAEAGINLRTLRGSGTSGRIVKRDIEEAMKSGGQPAAEPAPSSTQPQLRAVEARGQQQPAQLPQIEGASPYRDVPMSEMRRTIARRLVTSLGPIPHFFLTTEIEMDKAAETRRIINEQNPDLKLSINDLIIKVAAHALLQHPQVNASFQEKAVRYYERADIGVAVAIEDGLITPIVRGAESKGLAQIAAEVRELAERARSRKLRPEEFTGATFSISNLGMFGIDEFTAVINPPEAAILAVGAMTPRPVVRDGEVTVRQMMRVTMSCDHRVIDGATGARFLQTFKRMLENPLYMLV